jgi:hypothetical protein
MERATEIITKQRTTWGEIGYRFNWFFWGIILIILLAMIPVVGWLLGFGVFGTMLGRFSASARKAFWRGARTVDPTLSCSQNPQKRPAPTATIRC